MRKRFFAAFVFALIATIALLWWRDRPSDRRYPMSVRTVRENNALRSVGTFTVQAKGAGVMVKTDRAGSARTQALVAEGEAAEARVDIAMKFWGKVVDEADIPVDGAEITYTVIGYIKEKPGKMFYDKGITHSNTSGQFFIGPVRGHELTVDNVVKRGYRLMDRLDGTFTFAQANTQAGPLFVPQSDAPVTYRMAKLHGGAALVPFAFRGGVPVDGKPVLTSTCNGMLDGQFEIRFTGTPPPSGAPYDWTATVSLTGGSVKAAVDDYLYTAPSDGYTRTLQITMKKDNPGWRHTATVSVFARTNTGRYGRFVIDIAAPRHPYQSEARVYMDGAINPYGTRNLEPDAHSPP